MNLQVRVISPRLGWNYMCKKSWSTEQNFWREQASPVSGHRSIIHILGVPIFIKALILKCLFKDLFCFPGELSFQIYQILTFFYLEEFVFLFLRVNLFLENMRFVDVETFEKQPMIK